MRKLELSNFCCVAALVVLVAATATGQTPLGTAFTYQGLLKNAGSPANGTYAMQFALWNDPTAGTQIGPTVSLPAVPVTGGLFTATLDFGALPFATNEARWLQVVIQGTPLTPRQPLTPAPFSLATRGIDVAADGNVGLGTSAPSGNLHVHRDAVDATARIDTAVSGNPAVILGTGGQVDWHIGVDRAVAGNLRIGTGSAVGSANLVTVETGGNVGIGDTTPSHPLDVKEGDDIIIRARNTSVSGGVGILGNALATAGLAIGVQGQTASLTYGFGVYSTGPLGASGTKSFFIDHPLDPANLYLRHYSTEGPEPLNVYSGNVILGADGQAWVSLPDYFHAINRDFRYQLTPIGAPAPNLYVAQEIQDGKFLIAGGEPGQKVSWRIEALRNDPFVQTYGAPVVQEKAAQDRGKYLQPELYGQPPEAGIFYSGAAEHSPVAR